MNILLVRWRFDRNLFLTTNVLPYFYVDFMLYCLGCSFTLHDTIVLSLNICSMYLVRNDRNKTVQSILFDLLAYTFSMNVVLHFDSHLGVSAILGTCLKLILNSNRAKSRSFIVSVPVFFFRRDTFHRARFCPCVLWTIANRLAYWALNYG